MSDVLAVDNLSVAFPTAGGMRQVVAGIGFGVPAGRTLGVVGESGCGKSMTALAVMGLVPPPGQVAGSIRVEGREMLGQPPAVWRHLRGERVAMVFQEPMTALNPVMQVGRQIAEVMVLHQQLSWKQAGARAVETLADVGITSPKERAAAYPHQLSGGMRQRAMIAMALACRPALLIADEPTTALDVTIQAQILDLMRDLKTRLGSAIMLITHDLGVVAEMAERVVVMYAGRKVEEAPVRDLFARPLHPYTRGLLGAVPKLGSSLEAGGRSKLAEIPGLVPSLRQRIVGCAFAGRCLAATEQCRTVAPAVEEKLSGHFAACHYAEAA